MAFTIHVDTSDVQKKFGALKGLRPALLQGITEGIFAMARQSFERQASPEGAPWAPLSLKYASLKQRLFPGRPILQRRGTLLRTLFRSVEGNRAIVGSRLPYAAAHQFGFSGSTAGRSKKGKQFSRQMNLPARPFLPGAAAAEKEAARIAEEILKDALRKSDAGK